MYAEKQASGVDRAEVWDRVIRVVPRMRRLARTLCYGNDESAADLVAQTLLRVCKGLSADDPRDVWPYVRATLLNQHIDRTRTEGRVTPLDPESDYTQHPGSPGCFPHAEAERSMLRARVDQVVAHLSPQQTEVLRLYYADSLSLAELAARLGLSPEAAKQRLKRAREKFRDVSASLGLEF